MNSRATRVAMAGTFDAENFGDALFPLIARRELEERVPGLELVAYGLRSRSRASWGYEVRPLSALAEEIDRFDLLLIGGGHILRHDKRLAPGYVPEGDVHLPTGLWFAPALLAAAAGVPVAWNAIGASPRWPGWTLPLLRTAAAATSYKSVRDADSRAALEHAGVRDVALAPDTGLGCRRLGDSDASERAIRLLRAHRVAGPYALLQPTSALLVRLEDVKRYCGAAVREGVTVLEVAVGPIHGDRPGMFGPIGTVKLDVPFDPLGLCGLIAGAEAVCGQSLHLAYVAAAHGVPVYRPAARTAPKYRDLARFPGVHEIAAATFRFGRSEPGAEIAGAERALAQHWERVAELAGRAEPQALRSSIARLAIDLPGQLEPRRLVPTWRRPLAPLWARRARAALRRHSPRSRY